jgi:lipoyl(octanoyl) transferase
MPDHWLLLNSGPGDPAANMALDEALLHTAPRLGHPVLRFYSWTTPAATFGYFQRLAEVEAMTALRPLVRRPTGGGLVPHDGDWTYSLVFPASHPWHGLRAGDSYRQLHEWLQAAFTRLRLETELAPADAKELPGRCFAGPEKSDLTWRGRKIAGAAQRRAKSGLLIQGSIQPPPDVAKVDWQQALCDEAGERFNIRWQPLEHDSALAELAGQLLREKYSQAAYHARR